MKIGARHADKAALEIFSMEFAPMALVAQGMTGFFAGRPGVAPSIAVFHVLVEKSAVPVQFRIGDDVSPVEVAPRLRAGDAPDGRRSRMWRLPPASGLTVPLRRIAYARSGDKGDQANIGLIARRPEFAAVIREQVTVERVAGFFAHYLDGRRQALGAAGALGASTICSTACSAGAGERRRCATTRRARATVRCCLRCR